MTTRVEAFLQDAPSDWTPAVGEKVFIRRRQGDLTFLTATGVVTSKTMLDDVVRVDVRQGKNKGSHQMLLKDLRPLRVENDGTRAVESG